MIEKKSANDNSKKNDLIPVIPSDYAKDPDKLDFLGIYADPTATKQVLQSTNTAKVTELLRALKKPTCFEEDIFLDRHLPYYAMRAYLQNKITREQISHLLEFQELKATYPGLLTIPIFTSAGDFTCAAQSLLFYVSRNGYAVPRPSPEHFEQFRKVLWEKNKNISLAHCVIHLIPNRDDSGFRSELLSFSDVPCVCDAHIFGYVIYPGPVRNMLYPAITPKDSTPVKSLAKLDHFSIDAVEQGHRCKIRIQASGFPGTHRTVITHRRNVTLAATALHDALHQGVISYFPEPLYIAVLRCIDVIRSKTKIIWSAEIWLLIDSFFIDRSVSAFDNDQNHFAINESLSQEQSLQWFKRVLDKILSKKLYLLILNDMKENKSEWDTCINVELFFKKFVDKKNTQLFLQHKTLEEMIQESDIKQVITYAYILRWPGYTDTSLANLMSFEKNIGNDINICLLDTPLYHYSQYEAKSILMDINTNELAGIQLVTAAIAGDIATLSLINPEFVKSFYLFFALRTAVRFGHDKCLLHLLQFINLVHISEDQSTLFLHEASRYGHLEVVKILLEKWQFADAKSATLEIFHALPTAARRGYKEIVEAFLKQTKYKISSRGLQLAIDHALQRDDKEMIELLFEYVRTRKNASKLLTSRHPHNIDGMLRHSPRKCIVPIIQTFLGVSNTTYQSIFTGISRAGDVACAEEFTKFCQQDRSLSEEATNALLMDCMVQGFLPAIADEGVIVNSSIHYPMIYYQIDTFLMLSAKCNLVLNKDDMPNQSDVERLLNALFAGPCEIGIYYLINHAILKAKPPFVLFL